MNSQNSHISSEEDIKKVIKPIFKGLRSSELLFIDINPFNGNNTSIAVIVRHTSLKQFTVMVQRIAYEMGLYVTLLQGDFDDQTQRAIVSKYKIHPRNLDSWNTGDTLTTYSPDYTNVPEHIRSTIEGL